MKCILGTKQYMTQIFTADGRVVPGTVIQAGPAVVTQIKTADRDGYTAIQLGFGAQGKAGSNKARLGHLKAAAAEPKSTGRYLKEFSVTESELANWQVGQSIDLSIFTEGDRVAISGQTKGKGFQGVVKRHNFAGGPRTHGQKHSEREPGSIGAMGVQKVLKGTRMAGRMGNNQVTVKNLTVIKVDPDNHQLLVAGAVPGCRGSFLAITSRR